MGGGHNDADADAKISMSSLLGQFVCYFSVTVVNVYWSIDAAII